MDKPFAQMVENQLNGIIGRWAQVRRAFAMAQQRFRNGDRVSLPEQPSSILDCQITPELFFRLNLLNNAFHNSTDGIIITDLEGRIIEANRAFLDLFGYERDEVMGRRTNMLRSPHTGDEFYREMWESIRRYGEWKGEIVNRAKSGEEIPVWLSVTPIYEAGEKVGYLGVEIDMRKQKLLEKRLLQNERLAMVGQMAAKVAHEIRNPLAIISLNAELLEDEFKAFDRKASEEGRGMLRLIIEEIDRLSGLVEEYLQFSRLPQSEPKPGDIAGLVDETLRQLAAMAKSAGIEMITHIDDRIPALLFDPRQLRRVLLNLARNAIEAMPDGGMLEVAVRRQAHAVALIVNDSGSGIPDDDLEKIFEPFYSTKEIGTGLGLSIVQQIVHEHGGQITCRSQAGVGTCMTVTLPLPSPKPNGKLRNER